MDEDRFKEEVQRLIEKANLNQFTVGTILQDLADDQIAEWEDREPGEVE
jgi:predicted transcriptional regulator